MCGPKSPPMVCHLFFVLCSCLRFPLVRSLHGAVCTALTSSWFSIVYVCVRVVIRADDTGLIRMLPAQFRKLVEVFGLKTSLVILIELCSAQGTKS